MWVTKLLISPVKKRIFCPKTTKFGPKLAFFGQFGPGHTGLFNALLWVGWWLWRAGCISQDTYLLYVSATYCPNVKHFPLFNYPFFHFHNHRISVTQAACISGTLQTTHYTGGLTIYWVLLGKIEI